jgi:phosphoserine phosphatase
MYTSCSSENHIFTEQFSKLQQKPMVLIVDFDGTYLKNDFFAEQIYKKAIENPFFLLRHFLWSRADLLALKLRLLAPLELNYPVEQLVNPVVAGFIKDHREQYSQVVIASASPDVFVKRVLQNDPLFTGVYGSTTVNLKGEKKLKFILDTFGDNFHYIGDSSADIPIFRAAKKAYRVKGNQLHAYN